MSWRTFGHQKARFPIGHFHSSSTCLEAKTDNDPLFQPHKPDAPSSCKWRPSDPPYLRKRAKAGAIPIASVFRLNITSTLKGTTTSRKPMQASSVCTFIAMNTVLCYCYVLPSCVTVLCVYEHICTSSKLFTKRKPLYQATLNSACGEDVF